MRFSRNGAIDDGLEARNQFHGFEDGIPHDDTSSTEGEGEMGFREPLKFLLGELLDQTKTYCLILGPSGSFLEELGTPLIRLIRERDGVASPTRTI